MGPSDPDLTALTVHLGTCFQKITVLNDFSKYTGIEVMRDRQRRNAHLTQGQLVDGLFSKSELPPKFRHMPLNPTYNYNSLGDGTELTMHSAAGGLRFLGDRTRPNILASAGLISRGAHKPSKLHHRGWRHILQFLHSHRDEGVCLGGTGEVRLFIFADASHLSGHDSKSTIGFAFFLDLFSGAILARSKRSTTVDLSSTEAELKALGEAARQSVWTRGFLDEVGYPQADPTVIYTDSASAIALAEFQSSTTRANHLVKIYNYLRQQIEAKQIILKHISGDDNVADVLTKPLPAEAHANLSHKLMYGLDGIEPSSGNVATQHQLNLRTLAKMRAAKRRMVRHTSTSPSPSSLSCLMMMDEEEHTPSFSFYHMPTLHRVWNAPLYTDQCSSCGVVTCLGYEKCNLCLTAQDWLQIKQCRLPGPTGRLIRSSGLFCNIADHPVDRLHWDQNKIGFDVGEKIFQYNGEVFDNTPGCEIELMESRYHHDRRDNGGPYCLQRRDGSFIDAALARGVAAMANHGTINGTRGTRANAEFREGRDGHIFLRATAPIRNGDQIIANYARNFRINTLYQRGYKHFTTG